MKILTLEACVDSTESALIAADNGATRLELCQNLVIGGTTPSPGLFHLVKQSTKIPIRVLVRPRFGDFLYTKLELDAMIHDILLFREWGADAIVTGALTPDGELDMQAMQRLKAAAGPLKFTLHRAFDVSKDAIRTMEAAIELGIDTILTSGQAPSALEGKHLLKDLQAHAGDRITIMAGGDVNASSIQQLYREAKLHAFHMSGKSTFDSNMRYKREHINMGLPGLSEFKIWRSTPKAFQDARAMLDKLELESASKGQ